MDSQRDLLAALIYIVLPEYGIYLPLMIKINS